MMTNAVAVTSTTPWMTGRSFSLIAGEDVLADAGQREDLLDDQRAAQQVPELDADDGDRGAQRVLQGVLADDRRGVLRPFATAVRM